MNRFVFCTTALSMILAGAASASTLSYVSIDYNSTASCGGYCLFNGTYGYAAVNDNNVVATNAGPNTSTSYGYTYQNGVYSALIQNSAAPTFFSGINDAGEISGIYAPTAAFKGLTYNGTTFSNVVMPSGTTFTDGTPNPFTSGTTTSTFVNGLQEQGGTNSIAVGFSATAGLTGQTRGFVYNPANTTQPYSPLLCTSTATTTNPYAINDSGEVAGYCKTSAGANQQGFIYNYNTPNTAPTIFTSSILASALGDTVTAVFLTSIDDAGDLAGYYSGGSNSQFNGFYCQGNDTLSNCSIVDFAQSAAFDQQASVTGTEIFGINNVGSVVGIYTESDGSTHVFLGTTPNVSSAPEPGTIFLAAASIAGLAALRFRRKTARQ